MHAVKNDTQVHYSKTKEKMGRRETKETVSKAEEKRELYTCRENEGEIHKHTLTPKK